MALFRLAPGRVPAMAIDSGCRRSCRRLVSANDTCSWRNRPLPGGFPPTLVDRPRTENDIFIGLAGGCQISDNRVDFRDVFRVGERLRIPLSCGAGCSPVTSSEIYLDLDQS